MSRKILVVDLDGTLLKNDKTISAANKRRYTRYWVRDITLRLQQEGLLPMAEK